MTSLAFKILPLTALLSLAFLVKDMASIQTVHLALAFALLASFLWRRQMRFFVAMLVGNLLFLSYLSKSVDTSMFFSRLWPYAYAAAVFLALRRWRPHLATNCLASILFWSAFLSDIGIVLQGTREVWQHEIPEALVDHHTPMIFPYGNYLDPFSGQAIRSPELVTGDVNLLGSRMKECESLPGGDRVRVENCSTDLRLYPYGIYTTFFLTPEFTNLYRSSQKINKAIEQIQSSFAQGLRSGEGLAVFPRPVCSIHGYLYLDEIHADRMRMTMAGQGHYVLPILKSAHLPSQLNFNALGLLDIQSSTEIQQFEVRPNPSLKWLIVLFWWPSLIWLLWTGQRLWERW